MASVVSRIDDKLAQAAEQAQPLAPDDLHEAFNLFNQMSQQLSASYTQLEDRVTHLTEELQSVSAQRMHELAEKERLAERLEGLLNVLPGGVVVLDSKGFVRQANPAALEMLGEPLEGEPWGTVIERCFAPQKDDGHEISTKDGRRISLATRSLAEDGQIILLTDQTETRRLQSQLSRHERLSALGQMVSALAHQIRTPLSAAMLYAGHLSSGALGVEQQQLFSTKLLKRLNHMERQVQDMLVFVRGDIPLDDEISCDELQAAIAEEMEVLVVTNNVQCHWENHCPSHALKCHKDALIGAVLNLMNNAVQAGATTLQITFRLDDKQDIVFALQDDGPGMNSSILAEAKEVFVTTKAQGTGLGLAVVDSVARRHGGRFELTSAQGQGVCATLYLPSIQWFSRKSTANNSHVDRRECT